jgi:hypothetical protein
MTIETLDTTANDTANDTEIALLPPAQPIGQTAVATLMQHAELMHTAYNLAEKICRTAMCPGVFRGKPDEATVAIMHGAELGLGPLAAMQNIFPVHGKPSLESRTMVALLEQRGYTIKTVEASDQSVTVEGWSPNNQKHEISTWTIEKATIRGYVPTVDEKTGKYRLNANGKLIGNEKYFTHPEEMLWAKAAAVVCRRLAPHVLLGMPYTREELESEPPVESERVESRRVVEPANRRGVGGLMAQIAESPDVHDEIVDAEPEPTPEPVAVDAPAPAQTGDPAAFTPTARKKWLARMFAALNELDCPDRDDQLIVITDLSGRQEPPEHRDGITDNELRTVVNSLAEAKTNGTAGQLITDILNRAALAEAGIEDGADQ